MGSLPGETLCCYCYTNKAGYIPDGCVGPVCFEGENSCGVLLDDGLFHLVVKRRLALLMHEMMKTLAVRLPHPLDTVFNNRLLGLRIASYLFDA